MWGFLQAPPASFGIVGNSGQAAKIGSSECWDARKLPLLELAPPHKQRPAALQSIRSRSSSCSRIGSSPAPSDRENSSSRLQWPPQLNHVRFSDYRNSDPVIGSIAKPRAISWSSTTRRGNLSSTQQAVQRQASATPGGRLDYRDAASPRRQRKLQSRSPPPGCSKLPGLPRRTFQNSYNPPAERSAGRALQAMQGDKDFQKQKLQRFVEESDEYCRSLATSVIKRQEGQFFNFLCDVGEQVLRPDGKENIPTAMQDFDFLQGENSMKGQDNKISYSMEFTPRELLEVRAVLRSYAQASSPLQVVTQCTGSYADVDLVFRPTFCRFILDSRLVSEAVGEGRVPYHHAVSIFDEFAIPLRDNLPDGSPQTSAALTVCQTSAMENCIGIIALIMEQSENPMEVSHDFFSEGLPLARKIADALLAEASICAEQAAKIAMHFDTKEARKQRRIDIMVHIPPLYFDWTLWTEGLHRWIEAIDNSCSPTAAAKRCQQQLALKCFLDDILVEPGCLHVCSVFSSLFVELFDTYHDERRKRHDGTLFEESYEPHMSRAAFFRFCLDFSMFPEVCSFEEVLLAYDEAECLTYLGKKTTPTEKWRRTARKIMKMIAYLRRFGLLRWSANGQVLHSAFSSDPHSNDQSKRQSSDSRQAAKIVGYRPERKEQAQESHSLVPKSPTSESPVGLVTRPKAVNKYNSRRPQRSPSMTSTSEAPAVAVSKEHSWLIGELHSRPEATSESEAGENPVHPPVMRRRRSISAIQSCRSDYSDHVEDVTKYAVPASRKRSPSKSRHGSRRASNAESIASRVKPSADLSWLPNKFNDMSDLQQQVYALLRALAQCAVERFLNIKELFDATGECGETGLLDSSGFLRALSHLHVEHEFDEFGIRACMKVISPGKESKVDVADLEKAVSQVRDDMQRRRCADEPSCNASTSLGKQTWIDALPAKTGYGEKYSSARFEEYVFGCAAFMESVLRITIWHMHKSGVALKAGSTGGMKAMWMISFLRYQFHKMLEAKRVAETSVLSDASTCVPDSTPSPSFPKTTPDTARMRSKDTLRKDASTVHPGSSEEQAEESEDYDVEDPPNGARFFSSKDRLIAKEMLLLAHFAAAGPDDETLPSYTRLEEACSNCGFCRSAQGVGNIFCDACSGVDDAPLSSHVLFPIIERRRFRSEASIFTKRSSTSTLDS